MSKNITLKPKEEKKLLELAKKGLKLLHDKKKVPPHMSRAISSLIYYNQNLVKYIVRGYSFNPFFAGQVNYEDLVSEGTSSLLKAIEGFNLNNKSRFATYAGYWVRQYIQAYIKKNQFISQSSTTKEKKNVVFYDSSCQNQDEQSKSYSLIDTLDDSENLKVDNEQIRQRDIAIQINDLINSLEDREKILLVRLSYKVVPSNLLDIYYISEKEEQEELRKFVKLGRERDLNSLKKCSLEEKSFSSLPIVTKYLTIFAKDYKFSELTKLLDKSENSVRKLKKESFKRLQELTEERKLRFLLG